MREPFETGTIIETNEPGNCAKLTDSKGKLLAFNGDQLLDAEICLLTVGQTVFFERGQVHGPRPLGCQVRVTEPAQAAQSLEVSETEFERLDA